MKALNKDDYTVRAFIAHKNNALTYISGSQNNPNIYVSVGIQAPRTVGNTYIFDSASEERNLDSTYQKPLFDSVKNLFYYTGSISGTVGLNVSGVLNTIYNTQPWGAGGDDARYFSPTGSIIVINIPQSTYGEAIRPTSFVLSGSTLAGAALTASVADDGYGRLYMSTNSSSYIGNIFYGLGIAVINRLTSPPAATSSLGANGIYWISGSSISLFFDSTQTIYEYQIAATVDPLEFNYSFNPTASGSCISGQRIWQLFLSGTTAPYITTIGLYNDDNELIAIGKLPTPMPRSFDTQQTFIVRFDV